tara:strand:- start:562 stop:918 length:357 start_codon:yes stop_codon:yes gene_type:complete
MEKYIFFGESTVGTTGTSLMAPVSAFLGCTPTSDANTTQLTFDAQTGDELGIDKVVLTHTGTGTKEMMRLLIPHLFSSNNNKVDYEVIYDGESVAAGLGGVARGLEGVITSIAITLDT